ncbi:unnamed protein product [Didymodactylos carnosus]|uniref:Uncharacterized protein n=1 Tax=Didymodactylos carnosus TaxID=1234261 RepID=A0A8S2RCU1_9BILA|nr:unnamed protein product [Didymodactylos carnosus]CAF4155660.1 unnamed protein product [Didymodactylos carnosus]
MKNCSLIVRLIGILLVSYIIVGPVESLKFNENGTTVAGGNGYGSNLNELAYPWGLSVDNEMNVYVVDQNNHRVVKWLRQALTGELVALRLSLLINSRICTFVMKIMTEFSYGEKIQQMVKRSWMDIIKELWDVTGYL